MNLSSFIAFCVGFIFISGFYGLGGLIHQLGSPLPAAINGLIALLFALALFGEKLYQFISPFSDWMLKHLMFFFLPITSLLAFGYQKYESHLPEMLFICIGGTLIGITTLALLRLPIIWVQEKRHK